MECEVNGVTYISEPMTEDEELCACTGCIAVGTEWLCNALNDEECCICDDIVWVKK